MLRKFFIFATLAVSIATAALADVAMVEHRTLQRDLHAKAGHVVKPGEKPAVPVVRATGSQGLIDASGVKYFINTNITFSTSSSASAAMSEASYTHAVAATTLNGGTTSTTLNDAYDGYNTLCLSLNNTVATCETGNANFVIYNKNGPATTECPGTTSGVNRQVVFPVQTAGSIQMQRKVFVPDNDSFARWLNYFTNTSGSPQTVTAVIANNLGSDSNTVIVSSSNGNNTAEITDTWVTTFQNYSGTTSSDPRLGHVLQGTGATVQLAGINFADGDDNPFWGYTFTLAPGETKIIANFAVVQPSKAAANAKSASLAVTPLPANAIQCTTLTEQTEIMNFVSTVPIAQVPTLNSLGLLVLAAGLALAATVLLLRRRSTAV
ncbi:MAG TPA: hypothetical protein VF173_07040 [Thermoanaerobaculia bacterium]|nr:hypothetical protein [Thermoanaerobaculia bacterium]